MASNSPDPFAGLAARCGLEMSTAELHVVPRDVLAPPGDVGRHTLVTLGRAESDAVVRVLFVTEEEDGRPVAIRDVLWWLSSDSWAVENADRDLAHWIALYNYPDDDRAAARLFELHVAQAAALVELLGESAYKELLSVYQAEVAGAT